MCTGTGLKQLQSCRKRNLAKQHTRRVGRHHRPAVCPMAVHSSDVAADDHHTQSNYKQLQTRHADYDLCVDMGGKRLHGYCALTLKCLEKGTDTVALDTRGLKIHSVELLDHGSSPVSQIPWEQQDEHPVLGQALISQLPGSCDLGDVVSIGVSFETDASSTAVQFLEPQQTAGKRHPFLFTQCQAIHARALVPCQDTPSIKMTYTATVAVHEPLRALMSAETDEGASDPKQSRFSGKLGGPTNTFSFKQSIPVPSYLLALAVGELQSHRIGPRSRVWAEPPVLEAAAWEFAETEQYLAAAEEVAGEPYMWGQYDLLVLPPSFPYGGMENPCLTFVTPTLITGDRSATTVVAHEIAHSWTGNWVTNATWEHFWLNEGFTVFFERKIIGHVFGTRAEQFHAVRGLDALRATVAGFGADHPYTCLVPSLDGVDPDDSFSRIPYEKGFYFLYYLQDLVGVEEFAAFTAVYLSTFGKRTATTGAFKALLLQHFEGHAAIQDVDWHKWLHEPGMPPDVNQYDNTLMEAAEALAGRWHQADPERDGSLPDPVSASDVEGWAPDTLSAFASKLGQFTAAKPLTTAATRAIGTTYKLDSMRNPEVRMAWLKVCIAADDEAVLEDALAFAREQGRMKFVRPLYKALYHSEMGKDRALAQFQALQDTYHPIARKMIAADLKVQ